MYFAALLARTEDGWEASDTELDDVETLSDLTDLAREASVDEDTVLVFIEQEDAWFGVVRVDGEEDPRIYVSDAAAAARSSYGEIAHRRTARRGPMTTRPTISTRWTSTAPRTASRTRTTTTTTPTSAPAGEPVPAGPVGDRDILDRPRAVGEGAAGPATRTHSLEIADALGAAEVLETVR